MPFFSRRFQRRSATSTDGAHLVAERRIAGRAAPGSPWRWVSAPSPTTSGSLAKRGATYGSTTVPSRGDHRDLAVLLPEREGVALGDRDVQPAGIELEHGRLGDPGIGLEPRRAPARRRGTAATMRPVMPAVVRISSRVSCLLAGERDRGDAEARRRWRRRRERRASSRHDHRHVAAAHRAVSRRSPARRPQRRRRRRRAAVRRLRSGPSQRRSTAVRTGRVRASRRKRRRACVAAAGADAGLRGARERRRSPVQRGVLDHPSHQLIERHARMGREFGHERGFGHAGLRVDLETDESLRPLGAGRRSESQRGVTPRQPSA